MREDASKGQGSDDSKYGQFFIYYSGHGCLINYSTAGIDINGKIIEFYDNYIIEM